jgi:FixJ family two-component response regulator
LCWSSCLTIVPEKGAAPHALAARVNPRLRDHLQCGTMIAVVDDDDSVRQSLIRFLIAAGFQARGFASGETFLASWKLDPPDCLLLDVQMPGLTGPEVHDILNSEGAHFPVIIITSDDSSSTRELCMQRGALAYLTKPIDGEALLQRLTLAKIKPEHSPSGNQES